MCSYVTQSDVFLRGTFTCVGMRHSHASPDLFFPKDMTHTDVFTRATWRISLCSCMWHASYIWDPMWHILYMWPDWIICVTRLVFFTWHDSYLCVPTCDVAHHFVFLYVTCFIHMCFYVPHSICGLTHSHVRHDSFSSSVEWNDSYSRYSCVRTCDMVHFLVFLYVICLIHMCSHVWHGTFLCVTSATWRAVTSDMWRGSFIRVIWLIHACDMTRLHVWHDPFISVTWFSRVCDMTHSCGWHDSLIRVTWLIHMCDMPHSMCDMPHSCGWHDSLLRVTLATCCWRLHSKVVTYLHFFRWGRQLSS